MTKLRGNPWAILLTLCLGFFMVLLDITIVNIAIPSMIDGLKAGLDQVLWVVNAYTLTYAVLLITAGRLGDRYGQRNLFAIGLAIFVAASALCGVAQNPDQLILARIAQGVGGALLTPQTLAIITNIFPAERRGAAFGVWGAVAGVATIAGPVLGGLLTTYLNWRWIFYVNVPIGIAAMVLTFLVIPDLRPGRKTSLNLVSVLLASTGLFLITFGLIEGQKYDWSTFTTVVGIPVTIAMIIGAGFVFLLGFFAWDGRQASPLVPISLFHDRNFATMNWVSATVSFGMIGFFLPLTIFLQSVLGFSAIKAGLTFLPMSVMSALIAPIAGHMTDRINGKWILMTGLSLFAAGMGYVVWSASLSSDFTTFLPGTLVAGVGLGCTFAPMITVAMRNVHGPMAGAASGVLNTVRQLGGALGGAVVGAVLQNQLATALHSQALSFAQQLPPAFQQRFVDAFTTAAKNGLSVGRGQSGASFPAGALPPSLVLRLEQLAHDVFANAFVQAMRPTLLVPILVLVVGAISCLAVQGRPKTREVTAAAAAAEPEAATEPVSIA